MDVWVLDANYESIDIVDVFDSIIWTDRYFEYGDFEIEILSTPYLVSLFKNGNYLWIKNSEHLMIVEEVKMESSEEGLKLIVSGRSLESILNRRIVWNQTVLDAPAIDCIEKILNENLISPSDPKRKIENFIFSKTPLKSLENVENFKAQFRGETLYDVIRKICEKYSIGFKVVLSEDKKMIFSLYEGTDRSYEQILNPYVIFSPSYDNITESSYIESTMDYKNTALVAGEGEEPDRKTVEVSLNDKSFSGLERREQFVDASGISSSTGEGTISDEDYNAQLKQQGIESFSESSSYAYFDGTVDVDRIFKYQKDFWVGDIVQLSNEYGIDTRARIIEIIISKDASGNKIYPTVETIDEKE